MKIELRLLEVSERIGLGECQTGLDFGCGSATNAIPPARIVGQQGTVSASDKEKKALDELMHEAESTYQRAYLNRSAY